MFHSTNRGLDVIDMMEKGSSVNGINRECYTNKRCDIEVQYCSQRVTSL